MTELLRVYTELYERKQEYCVICLRSAQERRMVPMKSLESFIQSINLPFYYNNDFQKICFVCERAAAAAHRFRLAVNVSGSVHNLFSMMRARRGDRITQQLLGQEAPTGVVRNVPEWEQRVVAMRARTQLLQTEVLLVNSEQPPPALADGGEAPSDLYMTPDVSRSPEVTPDVRPPSAAPDVLAEPEIYMESVVIDDDEQDPIEIKREDPTLSEITIEDNPIHTELHPPVTIQAPSAISPTIVPIESLLESQNSSFLLHPIVEKNGVITVPSLAAKIVNGQLVTAGNSSVVVQTPKVALHNGVNFNLLTDPKQIINVLKNMNVAEIKNIAIVSDNIPVNVMENNVMQSMNLNNSQTASVITNNIQNACQLNPMLQLTTTNGGQIVVNPKQSSILFNSLMGYSPQQHFAKNNNLPSLMSDKPFADNNITCSIFIEDDDSDTNVFKRRRSMADMADGESKRRQSDADSKRSKPDGDSEKKTVKQRETDWEDKIPMDVISFMDATDPNAASVLAPPPPDEPPLGVISEVHSITEADHSENEDDSPNEVHSQNEVHTLKDKASRLCTKEPIVLVEDIQLSKENLKLGGKKNQPVSKNNQPNSRNSQPTNRNSQPTNRNSQPTNRNSQPTNRNSQPTNRNSQPANRNSQPASKTVISESIHQNVFSNQINSSSSKQIRKDGEERGDVIDLC